MISEQNRVRCWASILDDNTRQQAERLARSPAVVGPVALMPDAHLGAGATVGSVFLSRDFIIPAAVGVDIGCGMIATMTALTRRDLPLELGPLLGAFRKAIPAGVGQNHKESTEAGLAWLGGNPSPHPLTQRNEAAARNQLGTLGSGNHFLEVCVEIDDDRYDDPHDAPLWVVVHSGSRAVGNQLALQHIKSAQEYCAGAGIELEDKELAFLPILHDLGAAYLADMMWAQQYAFENREQMMNTALAQLFEFAGTGGESRRVNCHHNFAQVEHFAEGDLWVTRKGAISARLGDRGIIPGSMGAQSYITEGLGNPLSYYSSSHGAGRLLSRGAAKRTLTVESLGQMMQGCCWDDWNGAKLLDEHPHAYKPIDQVMADQKDLTRPVHQLTQIVNYKGL